MTMPYHVIIAAATEKQGRFLGPLLESLIETKATQVVLALSETVQKMHKGILRELDELPPTMTTIAEVPELLEFQKMEAWRQAVKIIPIGASFVALDVESLVLRPLLDIFPYVSPTIFSMAMPTYVSPSGRQTYYAGMLYGVANQMTEFTMGNMARECQRIAGRSDRDSIIHTYGSPLAAAYYLLKGQADDGGGAIMGRIPLNWVIRTLPTSAETGVVQFDDPEALAKTAEDTRFMTWFQHEKNWKARAKK